MSPITWSDSEHSLDGEIESSTSVELLQRARSGDETALNALFQRYIPQLNRWARGRLPAYARDLLDTDDLVQETMMHTVRNVSSFVPCHDNAFRAYLRQGLFNRICDEIRRSRRKPDETDALKHESPHPGPNPLEKVLGEECRKRYHRALQSLRSKDRELIMARIEKRWTYQRIAERLGRPSCDAARMAVARALVRLAQEMDA
ncbi:MAG TPA: sigma-70 family RNA polymerase sigma factor [Acidobacteriota bacterium]|nr:sigma-70 family RNA polymerase sigma factor [Acidobacteriota bacterium]